MNDPIQKLKSSADEVRLSAESYGRIKGKLIAHITTHPVAVPSPYLRFLHLPARATALALAALLTVGGATAYASEGSLPGDPLYPVKVKVVEPARGVFALTQAAKASWRAEIANERLSEVAELAAREKLTPEQGAKGDERFTDSLRSAQESIKNLSKQDPDAAKKIKSSLIRSLDEHQTALTAIGAAASSTNADEARSFVGHVKKEIESTLHEDDDTPPKDGQSNNSGKGNRGLDIKGFLKDGNRGGRGAAAVEGSGD